MNLTSSPSPNRDAWGLVWEGRYSQAYDEPLFRHLLALERRRSGRLGLPVLLLLIERDPRAMPFRDDSGWVSRIFPILSGCVRETDIMGWHRRDRVAGVVLTDVDAGTSAEVARLLLSRVVAVLDRRLPRTVRCRAHARIYRQSRPTTSISATAQTEAGEDRCSISG